MVGRGPYQVQNPNIGENNAYSNQLPVKTESYDLLPVKSEETTQTYSTDSKFSGYFDYRAYVQEVPQYSYENGIFVSPIEELANNPYKQLEQKEDGSVSFQKYPFPRDEQNWPSNNEGASYITSFSSSKEESLGKEDDILAQLFDLSGLLNDDSPNKIPSNDDLLIPVQTPSPATTISEPTNQIQTSVELSPQGYYSSPPPSIDNSHYHPYSVTPDNNSDPLVSVYNEGLSPPNNDLYHQQQYDPTVEKPPSDDLQILLNEILAVENFPLDNNAYTHDNSMYDNEISPLPTIPMTIDEEEEFDDMQNPKSNEDNSIPFNDFQFPPPTKKRFSESSSMEESPPPSISNSFHMESHFSPVNSVPSPLSPDNDDEKPTGKASVQKPRLSTNLFGQKEDEIIKKLLVPKPGLNSKPVTRDKLVTMNVEDFNALLDQVGLSEIEVAFMKEWRRRGKNKMAAQIARKRKRDELSELQDEIELLRRQKAQLKQSANNLKATMTSFKKRAQAAEERIYQKYSTAHGLFVSRETHNIHVTDDGKTMLVPRISSQVLLV